MILGSWASQIAAVRPIRQVLEFGSRFRLPTREEFRLGLDVFVRWWAAELWACLPARWQERLRYRTLHFLVRLEDDQKRIVVVERNNARPDARFPLAPENDQDTAALTEVKRAIQKQGARLELLVPEESIARRRMKVPLAAKNDLQQALKSELDRFTRFEHADVYFGHSVVETDHETKTITIDVAIVQRAVVDAMAAVLSAVGLKPSGAHLWRQGAKHPEATFFSVTTGPSPQTVRTVTMALIGLVFALDIAAAYVPLWLKIDTLSDLQARIETLKPKVQGAADLERALIELRSRNAYLVALKNQTPSMSEVLGELSQALPESAWLEQLQVNETRLQLGGLTAKPDDLIAALEQSAVLSDVRFEWPVIADPAANAGRFDISAQVERAEINSQ